MAISKVTLNGTTLMDATQNTANKDNTLTGYTGTKNDGTTFTGEYSTPSIEANKAYTVNSSGTLTVNPSTNYDAMEKVTLTVPSGSATPQSTISSEGATISTSSNKITLSKSVSNTPTVSAGYISSGTSGNTTITLSATATTQSAQTITPTTTDQTIASGTYLTGTQTISGDADLVASNIKKDVSIFGVTGTYEGGGSGSSYTLLASEDFTVSTSSTTATSVGTITIGSSTYTSSKIIYIKVRDKAGARNGYFVGSDTYIFNPYPANDETVSFTVAARIIHRRNSSGGFQLYTAGSSTGYGVYGYQVTTSGDVVIQRRYNSTYSLTINGTYKVEVYALDYAPNQGNPYNYSYSS